MIKYKDVEIFDLLLVKINEYYYFGMVEIKQDNKLILSNVIYDNPFAFIDKLTLFRYDLECKTSYVNVKGRLRPSNLDYDYTVNNMKMQNIHMIFPECFI